MREALRITGRVLRGAAVAVTLGAAAFLVVPPLLGWQVVTVLSGSMAPTYPVNAALAIRPIEAADVHEGDVIAFFTEEDRPMVTHRVLAIDTSGGQLTFVTKGDANEDPDPDPMPASAVRGRVVAGVPYLGAFVRVVHQPLGFTLFLVLPALALIAQEILSMRRARSLTQASPATALTTDDTDDISDTSEPADAGFDDFDFWTTAADEDRYYRALDCEVQK